MRRRAAALAAVALLLPASAAADRADDLERLRDAIEGSRERVASYEREERGLLEALEAIERSAELLEADVTRARRLAAEARRDLARAEQEAGDLAERLAKTERAMSRRAVGLYRAGELGAIPMLFSAGGLRDFLTRVQALRRLLSHDAALLARHREESRALEATRERAARAAEETRAAEAALAERSGQLRDERQRKRTIVTRLRSSRARERSALAELEIAARALEATVAALPDSADAPALPVGPPFRSLRGRLPPPVAAPVARDFGRVVDSEFRTATFRKGVEFDAPAGAPVSGVAGGAVRFAGRFRGYGNLVILDHGDAYFTVYAHLDSIAVGLGDAVAAGQEIGRVGDSGSLRGPHLYFEVRRGGDPLDPERWLRPLGTAASPR